jgi:hypothetical protein
VPREFTRFREVFRVRSLTIERQEPSYKSQRRYVKTSDVRTVTPKVKSQQQASAGVGNAQVPNPAFSIEIPKHLFQKLDDISTRENISLREFVSELLRRMLLYHRKETREIIENLKKRSFR